METTVFSIIRPACPLYPRFPGAVTDRITLEYPACTFYRCTYIFKSRKTNIFPLYVKPGQCSKNNDEGSVDPEIQGRKYRVLQSGETRASDSDQN